MKKFIMEKDYLEIFPDSKIGVLVCYGIDNHVKEEEKYGNCFNGLWRNLGCIWIDYKYQKCSVCNRLQSYACFDRVACNSLRNEFERMGKHLVIGGKNDNLCCNEWFIL